MSQHHKASKHNNAAPGIRKRIEAALPLACIECGNAVIAGDDWHVAHRVPASQGGRTTIANTGPAHAGCNLKAGGKLGAAVVNVRRITAQGRRPWL